MSHPDPATLYRIAAAAGCGSAVVLLVNAAKRAEIIPTSAFTQLIAPVAEILALALVTALYLCRIRPPHRHLRPDRLPAKRVRAFSTGRRGVRDQSRLQGSPSLHRRGTPGGSLGVALTAVSILFLLGTLAFVTALLRTREIPTAPLVLYAVGAVPVSLRAFVPEAALDVGLAVLALGIAWLGIWLFNHSNRIVSWTMIDSPPAHHVAA